MSEKETRIYELTSYQTSSVYNQWNFYFIIIFFFRFTNRSDDQCLVFLCLIHSSIYWLHEKKNANAYTRFFQFERLHSIGRCSTVLKWNNNNDNKKTRKISRGMIKPVIILSIRKESFDYKICCFCFSIFLKFSQNLLLGQVAKSFAFEFIVIFFFRSCFPMIGRHQRTVFS